jgi:hypothetical protein
MLANKIRGLDDWKNTPSPGKKYKPMSFGGKNIKIG